MFIFYLICCCINKDLFVRVQVTVGGIPGDASLVTAEGPGLDPQGVVAGRETYFDVYHIGEQV